MTIMFEFVVIILSFLLFLLLQEDDPLLLKMIHFLLIACTYRGVCAYVTFACKLLK